MADGKDSKKPKVELETSESAEAVEEAGWELLPHDLLLMVLAFLSTRQLLQVRAVNRQWRDAALDPSLWRSRSLVYEEEDDHDDLLCGAVLRLAPCLGGLKVNCESIFGDFFDLPLYQVVSLAFRTRCAVRELYLLFDRANAGYAAMIVRHQEALGRLRTLRLEPVFYTTLDIGPVGLLLDVACSCQGLEKIVLGAEDNKYKWNSSPSKLPTPEKTVPASLRELVDYSWLPAPHLAFLLRCHAPTLERLTLHGSIRDVEAVGDLLSRATNLVELNCCPLEGMSTLLLCQNLAKFTLDVRRSSAAAFAEANHFLRSAASLKTVAFRYFPFEDLAHRQCELLKTLASSAHAAAIEELAFILVHGDDDKVAVKMTEVFVRTFADALPRLSGVRSLRVVGDPSGSFLDVLSPASAPSLSVLLVELKSFNGGGMAIDTRLTPCAHSFIHRAEVRRALEKNALLHVKVLPKYADCFFRNYIEEKCEYCDKNCHSVLHDFCMIIDDVSHGGEEISVDGSEVADEDNDVFITVFNHPEGECCGVPHFETDDEFSFAFSLQAL